MLKDKCQQFKIDMRKKKMKEQVKQSREKFFFQSDKVVKPSSLNPLYFQEMELNMMQLTTSSLRVELFKKINQDIACIDPNEEEGQDFISLFFQGKLLEVLIIEVKLYASSEDVGSLVVLLNLLKNLSSVSEQFSMVLIQMNLIDIYHEILKLHQKDNVIFYIIASSLSNLLTEKKVKEFIMKKNDFLFAFWNHYEQLTID